MVSFAGDSALQGGDGTIGPTQVSRSLLSDSFAPNAGSGGSGGSGALPGASLYPQIGKLPINALGGATFDPGDFSNFGAAKDPNEGGLFGHILGGLGGITGNQDIANIGRGIGHLVDVPLGAAGDIAGLPGALITSLPFLAGRGGFDPAFQKRYDESVRQNPLNALLELGHVARAQYENDVESGRRPGLVQDFGPATNIADQLGMTLSLLALPQRIVARTIMGKGKEGDIAAIERGDRTITNPFYQNLQQRYEHGDFGPQGSQQARDAMLDAMAVGGQLFHTATSAPKDGWGFLGQTLVDIAGSLATDPLIIGDFGLGILSKTATAAGAAKATKVLDALDTGERANAATKAVDLIATERSITRDAAAHLFETEDTIRHRALMDVIKSDYPDRVAAATEGLTYTQKWASSVEPALRPIIDVVHRINDPLSLFGRGHANQVVGKVFDQHATEGGIRAFGFDNVIPMLSEADNLSPELGTALREGFGSYVSITGRNWMKTELAKDAKRVGGVPLKYSPTALVEAGLSRLRGSDIATRVEMYAQRYKPLYLALGRGPEAEQAALADARHQAAERMGLMSNVTPEEATQFAERLNREQIAAIDAAYFGHTARDFVNARTAAMNGLGRVTRGLSRALAEKLTIIGPRELTEERAKAVLAAISAGDEAAVREAVSTYDFLFENFAEHSLSTKALFEDVGTVIKDQLDHGGLTKSLSEGQALPTDLARWAGRNRPLGYTLGFRPEEEAIWRSTMKDGKLIAVNPWVDLTAEAGQVVGTYNRAQLGKERLWHNIRGEKIVLDARHNFARYTSSNWGLNRHQADTLFARILKVSSEANHAPRGMSPEQIYHIVTTSNLPEEITKGLTQREAVEALLMSFEGDFWHVGAAQKFTGKVKSELGMSSNYVGQLAERVYPMVRFTLNPIFQMQELVEPFFLNILRGVKPGFRASDEDKATIALIDRVIRHEKYAFDDQIERSAMLLAGGQATKDAFGPTTRLGKFSKRLLANDLVNIKAIKQVNYARLAREQFGIELHDSFKQVAPDLIHDLEAHYGTADWGSIAVKYLTEKAAWGDGKKAYLQSVIDATKQNSLGARSIVNLDDLAKGHFDLPDGAALRSALNDGSVSDDQFRSTLNDFKADPEYVNRALTVARAPFTAEEWWKGYLDNVAAGGLREQVLVRSLVQERAKVLGVSEEEWLARHFSQKPMRTEDIPGRFVGVPADALPTGPLSATTTAAGRTVRGRAVIAHDDPSLPETLYHVTTDQPAVEQSGYLRAGGKGGLGGDPNDRIVSMTTDRAIADHLAEDLKMEHTLATDPEPWKALTAQADREGWGEAWRKNAVFKADGTPQDHLIGAYNPHDWTTAYFNARQSATGRANPIIFPTVGVTVDPAKIGVIEVPRASLNNGALLTDFDRGVASGLSEVRSYGDVALGGGLGHTTSAHEEGRAFLAAAANPDRRTGLAQLAGILTKDLDPSGEAIILDAYNAEHGVRAMNMNPTVEQWFADHFSTYIEGGVAPVKGLRPAFEYFRKWLHQLNLTAEKQASRATFEATRKTYLTEARTVLRDERLARTSATRDLSAATKVHARAATELKRVRARSGVAERETKLRRAKLAADLADARAGLAQTELRAIIAETQLAQRKLASAHPNTRGGLAMAQKRKTAELRVKTDEFNQRHAELLVAQRRAKDASTALSAAKRRTPIKSFEEKEARARATLRFHEGRTRDAAGRVKAAERDVTRIAAAKETGSVVRKVETSPEMKGVFDSLFKPGETPAQHPLSGVDIGQAFDIQHEAVYRAAEMALRRAEETAFRVQYYKRGRNFIERSINHPYFGLYPASYMWGKTLPELIRFMVAKPFGIPAPLGGLALSNSVYRSVIVQQNLDPEYRKFLAKQAPTFQFASMLAPALPWEVPVNAPLWLRRVAEVDATNEARVKAGGKPRRFNAQDLGRTVGDVATYAFGPAYLAQELGKAAQLTGDFGSALAGAPGDIADSLGDVFAGNPGPAAPFQPGGG